MVMLAIVLNVGVGNLLVRDLSNNQEVRVNTRDARRFAPGDRVAILYNGAMTASIPPQISAISIQRLSGGTGPTPPVNPWTEMNARIVQRRGNALLVTSLDDGTRYLVNSPYNRFFCIGQTVRIRYDTIRFSNPPEINAVDILPICGR